jgi:hypothetical protein
VVQVAVNDADQQHPLRLCQLRVDTHPQGTHAAAAAAAKAVAWREGRALLLPLLLLLCCQLQLLQARELFAELQVLQCEVAGPEGVQEQGTVHCRPAPGGRCGLLQDTGTHMSSIVVQGQCAGTGRVTWAHPIKLLLLLLPGAHQLDNTEVPVSAVPAFQFLDLLNPRQSSPGSPSVSPCR